MRKAGLAISIVLFLAGCGLLPGGTTYPVAAKDARATLLLTEPPLYLFGSDVAKVRVSRDGEGTIRWLLVDRLGTGLMTLAAATEPVDEHRTRVTVSIGPPPGGHKGEIGKRLEQYPAIAKFYQAAMEEQIDATFEKREFDMRAIQGQMMAAAIALAPQIPASADEAAHRSAASPATSAPAYRSEPYEHETDEPAYGEPMDGSGSNY